MERDGDADDADWADERGFSWPCGLREGWEHG